MIVTGRLVWLELVGIVPALIWQWQGVWLWTLGVVLLAGVDALFAVSPRRLQLQSIKPSISRLGQPAVSEILVRNLARRPIRAAVADLWAPSAGAGVNVHKVRLRPGDGTRVSTALLPSRRGDLPAGPIAVRSIGPLGLAGRARSFPRTQVLRVLPAFTSRRHLPSRLARLRELDGRAAVQVRGEGTEFDSLREYVVGDDVRSIDWRATARRSEVVVRTWRPERDRRVLLVVDAGRTSAVRVEGGTRLDAGIEASLLLTALATHAGDHVDVVAFDRELLSLTTTSKADSALAAVADGLAGVEPTLVETGWEALARWIQVHHRQPSLVVLVTGLETAAIEAGLLPVLPSLTGRHRVVLASAATLGASPWGGDGGGRGAADANDGSAPASPGANSAADDGDLTDAFGLAASLRSELDRAAIAAELTRLGVSVIDAPGEDLAPRLADRYLELKAAGQL